MSDETDVERRTERLQAEIQALRMENERLARERDGARDAALEEARDTVAMLMEPYVRNGSLPTEMVDGVITVCTDIRRHCTALKSQPARRFLDAEEVRGRLTAYITSDMRPSETIRAIARDLGLDLDAAPAAPLPPTACGKRGHGGVCRRWDDHPGVCEFEADVDTSAPRETATVENGLLPAPRKRPTDLCSACGHSRRNHGDACCHVYGDAIPNGCMCLGFVEAKR